MPGDTHDQKRLNFFLFRRGLFDPDGWKSWKDTPNGPTRNGPAKNPAHSRLRREVARKNKIDQIAEEIEHNSRPEEEQY